MCIRQELSVAAQISEMRSLADKQSADPQAWGDLGQVYLAYGFNDAAADCFQNASRLDPQNFRRPAVTRPRRRSVRR